MVNAPIQLGLTISLNSSNWSKWVIYWLANRSINREDRLKLSNRSFLWAFTAAKWLNFTRESQVDFNQRKWSDKTSSLNETDFFWFPKSFVWFLLLQEKFLTIVKICQFMVKTGSAIFFFSLQSLTIKGNSHKRTLKRVFFFFVSILPITRELINSKLKQHLLVWRKRKYKRCSKVLDLDVVSNISIAKQICTLRSLFWWMRSRVGNTLARSLIVWHAIGKFQFLFLALQIEGEKERERERRLQSVIRLHEQTEEEEILLFNHVDRIRRELFLLFQ